MKWIAVKNLSILFLLGISCLLFDACKSKPKPSLSGEDLVQFDDLTDSFPDLKLPFSLADTAFYKRRSDTILISHKVFNQFVPDSVLKKVFGKKSKPRIYPYGKAGSRKNEKYLFVKTFDGNDKALLILCFDKLDSFRNAIVALEPDRNPATEQSMSFDEKKTLTQVTLRKNKDGTLSEGKDVYAYYPESHSFVLIMTDPLDDQEIELTNPIDTFSRKQKFTADYVLNKRNIVSIRDGGKPGKLLFFIHFEKNHGTCSGELKAEAQMQGANKAVFRRQGDPCGLEFTFHSASVTLRELTGCGDHRGIDCTFNGSYPRKKETKEAAKKTGT